METPAVNQIEVRRGPVHMINLVIIRFTLSQLHPFCQQKPIVEYCRAHGIVVQAYCPLIRGYFTNAVVQVVAEMARFLLCYHYAYLLTKTQQNRTRRNLRRCSSGGHCKRGASSVRFDRFMFLTSWSLDSSHSPSPRSPIGWSRMRTYSALSCRMEICASLMH